MFGRLGVASVTGATTAALSPEQAERVKADASASAINGAEIRISKEDLREIMQAQKRQNVAGPMCDVRGAAYSQKIYGWGQLAPICFLAEKWRGDYSRITV